MKQHGLHDGESGTPKPTLAEIFTDLKSEWLDRPKRAAASLQRHLKAVAEQAPMLRAVIAHNRGDTDAIPRLLRSEHELTRDDRDTLAHFLEGGFARPVKAGRHKSNERWVGMQSDLFLSEWRDVARMLGVSTYGETDKMREQAIEFIVAAFVATPQTIKREAVIGYMTKRGKLRRN